MEKEVKKNNFKVGQKVYFQDLEYTVLAILNNREFDLKMIDPFGYTIYGKSKNYKDKPEEWKISKKNPSHCK